MVIAAVFNLFKWKNNFESDGNLNDIDDSKIS